jgi:hypothetical protein
MPMPRQMYTLESKFKIRLKTDPIDLGSVVIPETDLPIGEGITKKRLAAINAKFEALIELLKSSMQQNKAENNW